jgi:hypothetical protein
MCHVSENYPSKTTLGVYLMKNNIATFNRLNVEGDFRRKNSTPLSHLAYDQQFQTSVVFTAQDDADNYS